LLKVQSSKFEVKKKLAMVSNMSEIITFSNAFVKAIEEDEADEVTRVIKNGQSVNAFNQDDGMTAMHKACKMGATKVVTALIGLKADLNLEMAESLETCLHLAALTYRDDTEGKMEIEDMISELVKAGALAFPARSGEPSKLSILCGLPALTSLSLFFIRPFINRSYL
jgi:ankyrin repeat protein